jgi:hypothetical protein
MLATYFGPKAVNPVFIALAVRVGSWCFMIRFQRN